MAILTTAIGAFPKPDYVPLIDWFKMESVAPEYPSQPFEEMSNDDKYKIQVLLDKATEEVVFAQCDLGIDIPTDGEIGRENYIYYHLRHLKGIDFKTLTNKIMRSESWSGKVPTITNNIEATDTFLARDWQVAQQAYEKKMGSKALSSGVKITLPGPMTIADTIADVYYHDENRLGRALAKVLNQEILSLAKAGCKTIQIDEPVFARYPDKALQFGIENLNFCFSGVDATVTRTMHMCCGYPDVLDNEHFQKAEQDSYLRIAQAVDESCIDVVSIEDAHCHNDLNLLTQFQETTVILGVVAIAKTRIESIEEIQQRIQEALKYIPKERLMIAPDCGLGMLPNNVLKQKLLNMAYAVQAINEL